MSDARSRIGMALCLAMLLGGVGCAGAKDLTITRDDYINTKFDPQGLPLSVDVVCVFPSDLKGEPLELNRMLAQNGGITADAWFERRPTRESMQDPEAHPDHYWIHRDQIFSFTNEPQKDVYGKVVGRQIQGNAYTTQGGGEKITVPNVPMKSGFGGNSMIYVFCRFTDAEGNILATQPAVFRRASDYGKNVAVHIGAENITRSSKQN